MDSFAGTVRLVLSGHDHLGGHELGDTGVPYVTLEAMLEAPDNAYGIVAVYADRIELKGHGTVTSRTFRFN